MSPENLQLQNASSEPPPIPPRLDTLPRELVLRIATFLIPETPASGSERPWLPTDVLHLSSTCRSLEFLASDGLLWKAIFKHTFAAPLGDGVSAMSFATLYKLRTMMARESIKILVPFNHTSADTLDDVSLVLARVWTEFLAADDGRNARFLASWNKIVEGLREAVGAVLGKVEARRGSTAVTGAETGNDTWKLLHLLACICIQSTSQARALAVSPIFCSLRTLVSRYPSPAILHPSHPDSKAFTYTALLYTVSLVTSGLHPVCSIPFPKSSPIARTVYDPVTESHLPNALKILADNDRKWSGYYSYAVHFDVEDPRGWDWDEFDGPMRNIHVAEESVHLGGIEFPEDDPRYRLQIRREGVDAIDSFVLSGSISRSGFAMLTKRYLTQGHGWSYRGHVVAVGTTVGIAGFWFPLGFEAVIEGGEWEGNCGPFCLWVE